MEERKH